MKKINILESNNHLPLSNLTYLRTNEEELDQLREYVYRHLNVDSTDEWGVFLTVMNWVHQRFDHDGINSGQYLSSLDILKEAGTGKSFRCAEYAKVTSDILLGLGYVARVVRVFSEAADYGGIGQSHVVVEVWSVHLKKWLFLDPQFNSYASVKDIPLNYEEFSRSFQDASIHFLSMDGPSVKQYEGFIKSYFGYVSTSILLNQQVVDLFLHVRSERQLLAFQFMQLSHALFTNDTERFYADPTQTTILFNYKDPVIPEDIITTYGLKEHKDFENNMHLFAVEPHFTLTFHTIHPGHETFEVRLNESEPVQISGNSVDWNASEGLNQVEVVSINQKGIKGSETKIRIGYSGD
ncbi:transglutaminase-like domain-containing protein [Shouchella sp. JSM 1781072]|uniref:transglutaminase-like domain-containing protein n=1 Tax=Shouchella sp. JSM 1781072 TaxID=3344581 RepID=UPI0035C2086B